MDFREEATNLYAVIPDCETTFLHEEATVPMLEAFARRMYAEGMRYAIKWVMSYVVPTRSIDVREVAGAMADAIEKGSADAR